VSGIAAAAAAALRCLEEAAEEVTVDFSVRIV